MITSPQAEAAAPTRPAKTRPDRLVRIERWIAFGLPLLVSLPCAWVLVLHYHSIYNDALSRLANAYYVFFSRDPHLAAVGFVWNPLPSIVDMPLLLFKHAWAPLSRDAFASNIMSCLFYAATCYQLYRFFEDLKLNRVARWLLLLCFAANPLVFYYGINGMSELLFIFTLVVVARYLARWIHIGSNRALVVAAFMLGVAYLARNEAIATAGAAAILVIAVSYRRATGGREARWWQAGNDVALFIMPFAAAFFGWMILSWIIVGSPLEQFTSQYGNAAQIQASGNQLIQQTMAGRFAYAVVGSQSVEPLLALAAAAAVIIAVWRRDLRTLAPLTVILPVQVFEILAYADHQIFPWYRYYIYACPTIVMTAACMTAAVRSREGVFRAGTSGRWAAVGATVAAVALCAPGILTTADTLGTYKQLSSQDRYQLAYILWPTAKDGEGNPLRPGYTDLLQFARQLDSMHLGHGQLMVDNFTTCIPELILDSSRPKQFAIPNDEDYLEKFGVPYQFGVRYFLVPDPRSNPHDAINEHLPGLYETGQGLARLVRQVQIPTCPTLRLYKLIPQSA